MHYLCIYLANSNFKSILHAHNFSFDNLPYSPFCWFLHFMVNLKCQRNENCTNIYIFFVISLVWLIFILKKLLDKLMVSYAINAFLKVAFMFFQVWSGNFAPIPSFQNIGPWNWGMNFLVAWTTISMHSLVALNSMSLLVALNTIACVVLLL